jgi:hypothetical protein
MQLYEFEKAEVATGEGLARQRHEVSRVTLCVRKAPQGTPRQPGVQSDFLNGRLGVDGKLSEVCLPGRSLLRKGMQATLKLSTGGKSSVVQILVLDLLDVEPKEPKQRLYLWSFLVTGQTRDPLALFPSARDGELLGMDDLLTLLGATRDDVGGAKFDTEGGFKLPASIEDTEGGV